MMLSTHKVEVVSVTPQPHPNADRLEVCHVFDGYPCVVAKGQFEPNSLAAYIPPDSVVDVTRPEFAFLAKGLKTSHRVRCVKLRGVQSFGLLVPAPPGSTIGDDVAEIYGVLHYEPEIKGACTGGEAEHAPGVLSQLPKYDVDSLRRYSNIFNANEEVFVSEKIHGANSRFSFFDGRMWCGSRSEWKRQDESNLWWKALRATPSIQVFCERNPGFVLYGEVFGQVQNLTYGTKRGEIRFAAFDVLTDKGVFLDAHAGRELCQQLEVPVVPCLAHVMPYNFETVCQLAEGQSTIAGANHVREGCVVKPLVERWHISVGRVQLKVVGAGYLEKS